MKYLEAVLLESERMHTAATMIFSREAIEDHYLGPLLVKKGVLINVAIPANSYSQQNYEKPFEFNPDRWLRDGEIVHAKPFALLTFHSGPRSCPGKQLA